MILLAESTLGHTASVVGLSSLVGYLIGSIPTAGLLGRLGGVDLRSQGSGNPGANNALRISGPWLAAAVLVVEAAKGYGAVLMGDTISNDLGAVAAGLGAVAGNVYNVWYRFQGGKGLGISSGVLAGLWPVILLPVLGVMVIGVVVTRSSGIASLAAIAALILMSLVWPSLGWPTAGIESVSLLPVLATGIGLVIVWKHWRDTPFSSHARR